MNAAASSTPSAAGCRSSSFSIDPYQIGLENDEAIESGAFWFYRKLGFRCTDPHIEQMAQREEKRMAMKPGHRTSTRTAALKTDFFATRIFSGRRASRHYGKHSACQGIPQT